MEYKLLSTINSPGDLKALSEKDLETLFSEIREFLIENTRKNGGHLASNLGAVELTVALHRIFDSPRDRIIFDVGHQSYVHKLITGRRELFHTLRRTGGLSGFTRMDESEHDPFGAGHSSTSISSALGYAVANRLCGSDAYTVAVLGDGSYTGGMIHEALNNCDPDLRLIIILNENGMSISVNKGRFASYLSRVRMSKGYIKIKTGTKSFLGRLSFLGRGLGRILAFFKKKFKNAFLSSNYFEDLGLYYIGPVDGNDYKKLSSALIEAKRLSKCAVVHIKTQKGKGYAPAEESPDGFHSVSGSATKEESFHSVLSEMLVSLASEDDKILAVTAAMGIGTGLSAFEEAYSDRYFDVGIAESHAVTFSAGLAAAGYKPYLALYSTFLQRAYDNVIHDVCLQNLPVRLLVDRASLSVGDGPTHHGIFDVAFLSHIPNIKIYSPITYSALRESLMQSLSENSPVAIRYPNSSESESVVNAFYKDGVGELGVKATFKPDAGVKYVFITYGSLTPRVISAFEILKERGISVGVVLLEILKPYDDAARRVLPYIINSERVLFCEEGIRCGGAGMILSDELSLLGFDSASKYRIRAIEDNFASPTSMCDLYEYLGLSADKLADAMTE